jgi:hypothetical protein
LVHQEIYFQPKNTKATLPAQRNCPVAEVDAMDLEMEEDDMMDDDTTMDDGNTETVPTPVPKFK